MPEYLAPGVYVEEVDTGSKPIEGVSTTTSGMVGVTAWGPEKIPTLVTGWADFMRQFGGYLNQKTYKDACFLPHSVEGFFTNGGKRLYVVRVLPLAATSAATYLVDRALPASVKTTLDAKAIAGTATLTLASATGVKKGMVFKLDEGQFAEYVRAKEDANTTTKTVTLEYPLSQDHVKGVTFNERKILLKVQAIDRGDWGNTLQVTPDEDDSLLETIVAADAVNGQPKVPLNTTQGIESGSILDFYIQKSVSTCKVIVKDALKDIVRFTPALTKAVSTTIKVRLKGTTEEIPILQSASRDDTRLFLKSVNGFKNGDILEVLDTPPFDVTVNSIQNALGNFVRLTSALTKAVNTTIKVRLKGTTEEISILQNASIGDKRLFLESVNGFKNGDILEVLDTTPFDVTVDSVRKITTGSLVRLKGTNWETLLKREQDRSLVLESLEKIEKDRKLEIFFDNSAEEVEVESIEVGFDTEVGENLTIADTE
jgi:hypothetical protein